MRTTVDCPGCGSDWELPIPVDDELTTEACECGVTLELTPDGVVLARAPEARLVARGLLAPAAPRRVGDVVRDILPELGR